MSMHSDYNTLKLKYSSLKTLITVDKSSFKVIMMILDSKVLGKNY